MARKLRSVKEKVETSKIKVNPRYDANIMEIVELCNCGEGILDKVDPFVTGIFRVRKPLKRRQRQRG